jgi:hypothetical protein
MRYCSGGETAEGIVTRELVECMSRLRGGAAKL